MSENIREKNIECFEDTLKKIKEVSALKKYTEITKYNSYLWEKEPIISNKTYKKSGTILVSEGRSMEMALKYPLGKTMVLNFASAVSPGGGVVKGSVAQEEAICRISNLYPCLTKPYFLENFYHYHKKHTNHLYDNKMIYSPNIIVFKTDTIYPENLDYFDWYQVDVLTAAAPNLRTTNIEETKLKTILLERIEQILKIAIYNKVDNLILGAFGCGAFKNPPKIVAECFYELLIKYHIKYFFEKIDFAIFVANENDKNNLNTFSNILL